MSPEGCNRVALCLFLACSLAAGCTSLHLGWPASDKPEKDAPLTAPSKRSIRVSQFVFLSNFELRADLPLFKDLEAMRDQIHRDLHLPGNNTIVQVYLFEDRQRYERFMKARYPDLPRRRAFFVAQPRTVGSGDDLLVYTYWGDRVQQDLRHELTHAVLHTVLKEVPLWLDEGLAEYYELPVDWKGINYQHLELLRRGSFKPDLARLEQLSQVQQMTPAEYREAWAWVQLMLGSPEARKELLAYVHQLRTNAHPGPLGPRLAAVIPDPEAALLKHLAQLDAAARATPAAKK